MTLFDGREHSGRDMRSTAEKIGCAGVLAAILVFIIAIVVPSFVKARNTSSTNACVNNLRQIDSGKEQGALAFKWNSDTDCDEPGNKAIVNMYIKGNITPLCPNGGAYSYNRVGKNPTCTKYRKDDTSTRSHHLPIE